MEPIETYMHQMPLLLLSIHLLRVAVEQPACSPRGATKEGRVVVEHERCNCFLGFRSTATVICAGLSGRDYAYPLSSPMCILSLSTICSRLLVRGKGRFDFWFPFPSSSPSPTHRIFLLERRRESDRWYTEISPYRHRGSGST